MNIKRIATSFSVYLTLSLSFLFATHSIAHASVSTNLAKIVYIKLLSKNNVKKSTGLVIVQKNEVNAGANVAKNVIILNSGMLNYVHNADELALVLGHELGHIARGDGGSNVNAEYAADKLGGEYMKNAGFNLCVGAQALRRLHSNGGGTHPASEARYKALGCE